MRIFGDAALPGPFEWIFSGENLFYILSGVLLVGIITAVLIVLLMRKKKK